MTRHVWVLKALVILCACTVILSALIYGLVFDYALAAALAAFAGGTVALVRMVPTQNNDIRGRYVDLAVDGAIAVSVYLAGWYWLLSETEGDHWPRLVLAIPLGLSALIVIYTYLIMNLAAHRQRREQ